MSTDYKAEGNRVASDKGVPKCNLGTREKAG
jgi:hypothetical protein